MILPMQVAGIIYRGSAPTTLKDFKTLTTFGIKHILNLEIGPSDFGDDSPLAESICADAYNIKVWPHPLSNWLPPGKAALEQSFRFINHRIMINEPLYVHCHKGVDRTGMVIAYYRMKTGFTKEQAKQEMFNHGMSWWLRWWSWFL